jgi:hypothetical protein
VFTARLKLNIYNSGSPQSLKDEQYWPLSNPVGALLSKRLPLYCTANQSKNRRSQNATPIYVATRMSPLLGKKGTVRRRKLTLVLQRYAERSEDVLLWDGVRKRICRSTHWRAVLQRKTINNAEAEAAQSVPWMWLYHDTRSDINMKQRHRTIHFINQLMHTICKS